MKKLGTSLTRIFILYENKLGLASDPLGTLSQVIQFLLVTPPLITESASSPEMFAQLFGWAYTQHRWGKGGPEDHLTGHGDTLQLSAVTLASHNCRTKLPIKIDWCYSQEHTHRSQFQFYGGKKVAMMEASTCVGLTWRQKKNKLKGVPKNNKNIK